MRCTSGQKITEISVHSHRPCERPLVLMPFINKSGKPDAVKCCRFCDSTEHWPVRKK